MPTTPFIGISVLIHIVIIVFRKIFPAREGGEVKAFPTKRPNYFVSFGIMFVMAGLMLSTAVGLLTASVTEKHSTVYLVEDTAQWMAKQSVPTEGFAAVAMAYRSQEIVVGGVLALFIISLLSVSLIRFPRRAIAASQGGYSLVQVSLFISGIILVMAAATYIAIYLLIVTGQ